MRARSIGTALLLALAYGCGGSQTPVQDASRVDPQGSKPKKADDALRYLPAHPLVEAREGTFGPYVGRSKERSLAVWAAPTERGHRWMSLLLDGSGAPTGPVRDAGAAPDLPPRVVVRPLADGFAATFTYRADLSSIVAVLAFSATGEPKGEPVILTQSADPLLYADVVSLDGGAVLVYAAQKGNTAELMAIPIAEDGRPRGSGGLLASDALAWQPVSLGEIAALAFVSESKAKGPDGQVALVRFDDKGRLVGERSLVSESATAFPDLDATRLGEDVMLSWTDRRDLDARVYVATADRAGQVLTAPRPVTLPRGDQALMGLVGGNEGTETALVAWEELAQETSGAELPAHARVLRLGLLGKEGILRPRTATLALAGDEHGAPEFSATNDGWAATTLAPACARPEACPSSPLVPTAIRFDRDLGVVASEPLFTDAFGPAALAWGLSCEGSRCTVLAAGESSPAQVFAMELSPRKTGWIPAAKLDRASMGPRAIAWETLLAGEKLADVDSLKLAGGSLVGWVTHVPEDFPDPSSKTSPKTAATVGVRALDERGEAKSEPTVISVRGTSVGGIALAADSSRSGEACLAWVGHDAGQTQVFATRLGEDGKKLGQQMITRAKGGVADVAMTPVKDGWIVAWVDWRDGNGEVYATKIDRSLKRTVPERRITKAQGDASFVQVATQGDEVWLAWADARDEGEASNPYTIRLAAKDLQPRGEEIRIAASPHRSRALRLTNLGEDMVLGFIEERTDAASDHANASAKLVRLDARGAPLGMPVTLPLEAPPTSLALDCDEGQCRGLLSLGGQSGELRLDAFTWDGGGATRPAKRLLQLLGSSSGGLAPTLAGDSAFFVGDDFRGDGRLWRMRMVWE